MCLEGNGTLKEGAIGAKSWKVYKEMKVEIHCKKCNMGKESWENAKYILTNLHIILNFHKCI